MKKIVLYCACILLAFSIHAQTGKYMTVSSGKCKNIKVYIDPRVPDYCGTLFTVDWSGGCKDGYAEGEGTLTITSKVTDRSFILTYDGGMKKGKKEGKGVQTLSLYAGFLMAPYYKYDGAFKNDDFDGYGEFSSEIPYPVPYEDIGKGVSMEAYALYKPLWRTNMFFYEYKGQFKTGRIADTENAKGKTKRLLAIADVVTYEGAIVAGLPQGRGHAYQDDIIIYPVNSKKSSYTGDFNAGRMQGKGKISRGIAVGSYYEYDGELMNNRAEGKGTLTVYKERMTNYRFDGWDISYVIDGDFKDNQANGFCNIYYQGVAAYKYTGPMRNGAIDGTGELLFRNDSKIMGSFKDGKIDGEVTAIFANGNKFIGIFSNDKPVSGKLLDANGNSYEGAVSSREEKDKITGKPVMVIIRQGEGVITEKDGTTYKVTCENDNCTKTN